MPKSLAIIYMVLACTFARGETPAQLLSSGHVDEAISALQSKVQSNPSDAESFNLLCRSYFTLGNWDRAVSACEKAVALQPSNSRYHLWLGRAYGEKADSSNFLSAAKLAGKVRGEFEKAVQLAPNDVAARADLAEFYLEAPGIVGGGQDKAEAQASTLNALDPSKARWIAARIAEKKHDSAAAEREYKAAIEASHGSDLAWLNLAFFYRKAQRYEDMENAINHAVAAKINRPEVLMEAAETLIRTGRNFPGAVQLLRRYLSSAMVEEAPAFKAHYLLGSVLEKQGNPQEAAQEYRAALALAKNYSRAQDALNKLNR